MSNFFQQLIDLGAERPEQRGLAPGVEADVDAMPRDQLAALVKQLHAELQERKESFDALRAESGSLRSEYDAYKLKVENWQLKMKEARDEDRKLIAQLRAAGDTGGNTDDLMVKSLNDTINKYKEELRKAHDDVAKEYKRRQDAEESRARFEEAKNEELASVVARFDKMRETMKKSQATLQARLEAAEKKAADAAKQLMGAKRAAAAAATAASTNQHRGPDAHPPAGGMTPQRGSSGAAASGIEDAAEDIVAGASPEPVPPIPKASSTASVDDREGQASPSEVRRRDGTADQIAELESARRAAELRASEALKQLEDCQRQLEECQNELSDSEKRLLESRSHAEMERSKRQQSEGEAERARANWELEEKKLQRQIRVADEALTEAKAAHVAEEAALNRTIADLRAECETQRVAARARASAIEDAEQSSVRAVDALTAERNQLLSQLAMLERRLSDADLLRDGLHETIRELQEDVRRRDSNYDDLRRDNDEQSIRVAELEAQLAANVMTVTRREDDVVSREREKQVLKQQLSNERDAADRLRKQLAEAEDKLADEREQHAAKSARLRDAESDRARLQTELRLQAQKVSDGAVAAEAAQHMIRDLQVQLSEQGSRTADVVKVREDQSARVRQLEARLREAEARLHHSSSISAPGTAASEAGHSRGIGGAPSSSGIASMRAPHPSAVLQTAFSNVAGLRITWHQARYAVAACLAFVLLLTFFHGFGNAPTGRAGADADAVLMLKEKYAQALQSALSCRESMKGLCPCGPPTKGGSE